MLDYGSERAERAERVVGALESAPGDEDVRILASHRPDAVCNLKTNRRVVSKGVGVERGQAPQVRLNVVPNIGIIDLG